MTLAERAAAAVDAHFDHYLALLVELVRRPSPLGSARPSQELIHRQLRRLGLQASIQDIAYDTIARHPGFAPVDWSSAGQPNVWGVLPPKGKGGNSLALNGHIDVVPSEPNDWWTFDPWGAEIDGGRLFGRGALDMKSGLVAGLLAIQAIVDAGVEDHGTIVFESVIEEECSGNGMLAQRLVTGPVDGAVILEPTGLQTWMATPGVVWFETTVRGKAAYVGRSSDYVNAVESAAALIGRFKPAVVTALNESFTHPAFAHLDNSLALSVGTIEGGVWPSSVPLECRFTCRMSHPIGWSFADTRGFVERQLAAACASDPWLALNPPSVRFNGFRAAGWEADPDWSLLAALDAAHAAESNGPVKRAVFPGTADARFFGPDEQVVYYGPAGGGIHGPDEYVEIESVRQAAKTLARLIVNWTG